MPKGYWIAHNTVSDTEAYENYKAANASVFAKYNARFVVRGGRQEVMEGESRPRTVVIEFDSYADAMECYQSAEYQAAKALRDPVATGDLIVIEGYDG